MILIAPKLLFIFFICKYVIISGIKTKAGITDIKGTVNHKNSHDILLNLFANRKFYKAARI